MCKKQICFPFARLITIMWLKQSGGGEQIAVFDSIDRQLTDFMNSRSGFQPYWPSRVVSGMPFCRYAGVGTLLAA